MDERQIKNWTIKLLAVYNLAIGVLGIPVALILGGLAGIGLLAISFVNMGISFGLWTLKQWAWKLLFFFSLFHLAFNLLLTNVFGILVSVIELAMLLWISELFEIRVFELAYSMRPFEYIAFAGIPALVMFLGVLTQLSVPMQAGAIIMPASISTPQQVQTAIQQPMTLDWVLIGIVLQIAGIILTLLAFLEYKGIKLTEQIGEWLR